MLGIGLMLANVPGGVVDAFPRKWGVQMRAAALATIFLRCGLELEFKVGGKGGIACCTSPLLFAALCSL
jgi:hypothetical protein